MSSIYNNRFYRYKSVVPKPDLIVQECTLINNSTDSTDPSVYLIQHAQIKNYLDSLSTEYFYVIPNGHKDRLLEPYIRYWDNAKAQIIKDACSYLDIQKVMYKMWQYKYPNKEVGWQTYFASLMYDGACHPNDKGLDFFRILLEPIFDLI